MLVAWLTKKGHVLHRRGGQLFVAAMSASLATAVVVALWRNNHFLLLIALFSGYFVYTGARLALVRDGRRSRLDQIITLAMLAVVVCMTALAFTQWQSGDSGNSGLYLDRRAACRVGLPRRCLATRQRAYCRSCHPHGRCQHCNSHRRVRRQHRNRSGIPRLDCPVGCVVTRDRLADSSIASHLSQPTPQVVREPPIKC